MYKRLKKIKKLLPLYIMALPALVYLFINNYLPLTGMVVAFKDFDYSKGTQLLLLLPETQYCTMWHLL